MKEMASVALWEESRAALWEEFWEACKEIADECVAEGFPSYGSNYELRVERLKETYPELFDNDDWDDDEYYE